MNLLRHIVSRLFVLIALILGYQAFGQQENESLSHLVELLGRSEHSPKLEAVVSEFNLTKGEVENREKKRHQIWYGDAIDLFFTTDDVFGEKLHVVNVVGFQLESAKTKDIAILKQGVFGIKPYMKRSKVDALLKDIDPDYANDGGNQAWADRPEYRIKVQFNGSKPSSKVLRVYAYLKESEYKKRLNRDFDEYGVSAYYPNSLLTVTNKYANSPFYINALPIKNCENCKPRLSGKVEYSFDNGNLFDGYFKNGFPDNGSFTFTVDGNTYTYQGKFKQGEATGYSKITVGGQTVRGTWRNGVVVKVRDLPKSNFIYRGDVSPDFKMNGNGAIVAQGFNCIGKFMDDQLILEEVYEIRQEGLNYKGQINAQFQPNGKGTYHYKDRKYLRGEFENGQFQGGSAHISLADGTVYTGKVDHNGQPHGEGELKGEGKVYIKGSFEHNVFSGGSGYVAFSNGDSFEGAIDKDKTPQGKGTYHFANDRGSIYGEFSAGKFSGGSGLRKFPDGSSFSGPLDLQGNPDGEGKATLASGTVVIGKFKGTKPVGDVEVRSGQMTWVGPVDEQYRANGYGKYRNGSYGDWQYGTFSHGKKVN